MNEQHMYLHMIIVHSHENPVRVRIHSFWLSKCYALSKNKVALPFRIAAGKVHVTLRCYIDELGIFHANQTFMALDPHQN